LEQGFREMAKPPRTIYLVRQSQLLIYAEMVERLKAFDLTPAQYMVLSLSSNEDGLSSADLARRSHITPQSMNEIIAALDRKGLLKRREDPDNRRILRVAVNKEGARLLAECNNQIDKMEMEIFGCFDHTELVAFRALHTKLLRESPRTVGQAFYVDDRPTVARRSR
jgi:DNA-binding MarR family transcriptional regulator